MARHGPLKKPTMASMPVLVFLADHPELLLSSASTLGHTSYSFKFFNGRTYRGEDQPEIGKNLAIHRWMQSGWMDSYDRGRSKEDDKGNSDNHWAWYDRPKRMTDAGRAMVEKWRSKYEEHLAAQEKKRQEVDRLVVVRTKGWRSTRQYGILARVVKETAARLYIEIVEGPKGYSETIHGRKGHLYVEKADVTKDGVTQEEYQACRIVETNHLEWLAGLREKEEAEIAEVRKRFDQCREQNKYAYEDELREALEQVKRNAD